MRTALGVSKSGNPSASCLAASPLCHVAWIMGCAYVRMLRTYCFSLNQPAWDRRTHAGNAAVLKKPTAAESVSREEERERERDRGGKKVVGPHFFTYSLTGFATFSSAGFLFSFNRRVAWHSDTERGKEKKTAAACFSNFNAAIEYCKIFLFLFLFTVA